MFVSLLSTFFSEQIIEPNCKQMKKTEAFSTPKRNALKYL